MERRMLVMQRDCPARLVPAGTRITITKDTFVSLTQDLGGTYTVNVNGNLARIDGTDADALGLEPLIFDFGETDGGDVDEDNVWAALRTVYDPEIPVNVVDLGLIYACRIDGHNVAIDMTLTAPGCGMGPVLLDDIKYRVGKVPNVEEVTVELVFDPPWARDMMSEEAQLELGVYG
jgi:probable FeS assembly SUF system protein SufT